MGGLIGASEDAEIVETSEPAPLTEKEAKGLTAGPFGDQLHRLVVLHITYLVFGTRRLRGEPEDLRNATCFFIKTPVRLLAVTARHVVEAFRVARAENPRLVWQIGNLLFDPNERLIALGTNADVATFDVSASELERIGKCPITLWPPHPPEFDDRGVLLAGYPAAEIIADGLRTRCFGIYAASAVAQRVTDRQLSCSIEWEYTIPSRLGNLPPRNYGSGGMSGGPMLTIRQQRGILTFPLAGVISEGRSDTDTVVAERADCVRANGTIRD